MNLACQEVLMVEKKSDDPKSKALQKHSALNPLPDRVKDSLFQENEFFDLRDLVQVKYEMIRRVRTDDGTVAGAAQSFGFSRPSFYQAHAAFEQEGLMGLVPKKRGPRTRHKLGSEVMAFIEDQWGLDPTIRPGELAKRIAERFGISVHRRSIERALSHKKKNARSSHGGSDGVRWRCGFAIRITAWSVWAEWPPQSRG
jgi:transposase